MSDDDSVQTGHDTIGKRVVICGDHHDSGRARIASMLSVLSMGTTPFRRNEDVIDIGRSHAPEIIDLDLAMTTGFDNSSFAGITPYHTPKHVNPNELQHGRERAAAAEAKRARKAAKKAALK